MTHSLITRAVVAVDGLAGSGKTALSRELAARLGFVHLSTGILYRAVAFLVVTYGIDPEDSEAIASLLGRHSIELALDSTRSSVVLIDGVNHGAALHEPRISELTSTTARHQEVRDVLVKAQREAFPGEGIVVEGRDMGTVIFPDAPVKFFVETPQSVRIERRIRQLFGQVDPSDEARNTEIRRAIEIEVIERDERDTARHVAPTCPAPDSILVDNSGQTLTKVVDWMYTKTLERGIKGEALK